jgi:CheY-like chemotaxis protein
MMERVICVDDETLCLFLAELTIKESNFANEIFLVENAPTAISLLNKLFSADNQDEEPSTLILLDINMPVMNGWEFLDANDLPIFFIQSHDLLGY